VIDIASKFRNEVSTAAHAANLQIIWPEGQVKENQEVLGTISLNRDTRAFNTGETDECAVEVAQNTAKKLVEEARTLGAKVVHILKIEGDGYMAPWCKVEAKAY